MSLDDCQILSRGLKRSPLLADQPVVKQHQRKTFRQVQVEQEQFNRLGITDQVKT